MPPKRIVNNKLADGKSFEDLLHTKPVEEGPQTETTTSADLAPVEAKPSTEAAIPASETPASPKPYVFEEHWDSIPKDFQDDLNARAQRLVDNEQQRINKALSDSYGDLYDPDFLKMISENKPLQKKLRKLSDAKLQGWFDIAYEQYEQTGFGPAGETQAPVPKEVRDKLSELEDWKAQQERTHADDQKRQQTEARERSDQEYFNRRVADRDALHSEYPEMRWKANADTDPSYKLFGWLHDFAEAQSAKQQRYVSYKEVYEDYRALQAGRTAPPPAIPATSDSGPPNNQPQAPTNIAESRKQFDKKVKQAGGTFDAFALSLSGKKQ